MHFHAFLRRLAPICLFVLLAGAGAAHAQSGTATRDTDRLGTGGSSLSTDPFASPLDPRTSGGTGFSTYPPTLRGTPSYGFEGEALPRLRRPREAEPYLPNDFQLFVEQSTGRLLPIFGSAFFADSADPDETANTLPASADYVVGPGDELLVRLWGSVDATLTTKVDRDGMITLPRVGTVPVMGVRVADLDKHLRAEVGRYYKNFNLSVTLGRLRSVGVLVVGPTRRPGTYALPGNATFLSAVVASGGPGPNGSMRKVMLRRAGAVIAEFDIYDLLLQGDRSKDVRVQAGDVVVYVAAGPRVAVTGAIDNAGIYELKNRSEPLDTLLAYAGGLTALTSQQRAHIERIDPARSGNARVVEEVKLDAEGLKTALRDGDVITLLPVASGFANAVTLRGHVAQPLRYAWHPGMRLRDLIPDKEALIAQDYVRRRDRLVQMQMPSERDLVRGPDGRVINPAGGMVATRDLAAADASKALAGGAAPPAAAAPASAASAPEPLPVDPLKQPPLFEEINWDYAIIERLDPRELSTQIIPFSPRRAILEGDAQANLELRPGDVVTIFSQKSVRVPVSRQTRLAQVEGEVGAPGLYQLQPGETLRQLLQRAGGLTPQAYVYGLEFTREETRRQQEDNLNAAIQRLESVLSAQAARETANQRDEAPSRAAQVNKAVSEAQLQRLKRLKPNGRIALELEPSTSGIDGLPDVPLEGGDHVTVPTRPGFVTVAGAVANNNAFLWKTGRTADDYLRLAGKDEVADLGSMFILRADGTITHAGDSKGFLGMGGGIGSLALYPGDALIVPNQLDYETWGRAVMRNLKDWGVLFYQFGLGAAAIKALR